jgi:glucan phosphoethanolaminetransferase (alkaline phosphatase superfamily)
MLIEIALYVSFTCIGILGKLWAVTVIKRSWQPSALYVAVAVFIMVFLGQSTFELVLYFLSKESVAGRIALTGYYLCAVTIAGLLPFMIARLTRYTISKFVFHAAVILYLAVFLLLLLTDAIIAGISHTGIIITRIPGSHYWLFQLLILSSIFYSLYILIKSKKVADGFLKIRTNNVLLSFSLVAIFVIFIIIAMQFFNGINAVGILPLVIALFVMGVVDNICNKNITDYSYWIPFSKKRRQLNKLIKPFIEIQSDGLDLELKKEYNKLITQHALELFDGNQTKAAEWLKVSQSWVSRNNKNINV